MGGVSSVPGRGRKPKPQEAKRAAGNPGRRPLNTNVPEFADVVNISRQWSTLT